MTLMFRQPRKYAPDHLAWIRTLPCICCMDNTSTEAAHIRFQDARAAKPYVGKQSKADDMYTLPLCGAHHRMQHGMTEHEFWAQMQIDPVFAALALWSVTGDYQRGEMIVQNARAGH